MVQHTKVNKYDGYTNIFKDKNHMIIPIAIEKVFERIQIM